MKYVLKNSSDDEMFSVLYSFDANQAFDPLSLVASLLVILQERFSRELQAALLTPDGRLVALHLRHGERHRLLDRSH